MNESQPPQTAAGSARKPIEWEAHEYLHVEKGQDWYWILGLFALASAIIALLFNNVLFALFILIASFVLALMAGRKPDLVQFALTQRGLRIDEQLFPFGNLASFAIIERSPYHVPKLILVPKSHFSMDVIVPLENVNVDEVHDFIRQFLHEGEHEEPLSHRIMEWLGF